MDSEDKNEKREPLPLGAWLPWLPLLVLGFIAVTGASGLGGALVPLVVYLPVSFLLGAVVVFAYRKNVRAKNIAALILFGGPMIAIAVQQTELRHRVSSAKDAQEMLHEICAEQAGAVIYRTAKDVEGVLQMDYREDYSLIKASRDDVPDPWYQRSLNSFRPFGLDVLGGGYFYLERKMHSTFEDEATSITYLALAGDEGYELSQTNDRKTRRSLEKKSLLTKFSISRYGWQAKNLTTDSLRRYWISGGAIEIVDLEAEEVMARLTNFYQSKAIHTGRDSWEPGGRCKHVPHFASFIREVLQPVQGLPSQKLIESLEDPDRIVSEESD